LVDTNGFSTRSKRHVKAFPVGLALEERCGLEVAVVADGFETGAAELGGDIFGGEVETAGGSGAAFENIGRNEGKMTAEGLGGDVVHGGLLLGGEVGGEEEGQEEGVHF
jgi:hypothetical protein